jgi:hypothetical protein
LGSCNDDAKYQTGTGGRLTQRRQPSENKNGGLAAAVLATRRDVTPDYFRSLRVVSKESLAI